MIGYISIDKIKVELKYSTFLIPSLFGGIIAKVAAIDISLPYSSLATFAVVFDFEIGFQSGIFQSQIFGIVLSL